MKFISTFWERLEEFILVALFAFMAVMNFLNVVFRYCFANSFSFTEFPGYLSWSFGLYFGGNVSNHAGIKLMVGQKAIFF